MVGRAEWLAGQISVSDIGRSYGTLRQAITFKAKREKWPPWGALVGGVGTLLLEDKAVAADVTLLRASWPN